MILEDKDQKYSLAELLQAVTKLLADNGLLDAQQDNRVSAAPDARTIRYYTSLGLLDRPNLIGRQAYYGKRHLLQIGAIKALQGLSLPLSEIQAKLYGCSENELIAILTNIAKEQAKRPVTVHLVRWQEVTIEPGLKILAEDGWTTSQSLDSLMEKIKTTLSALSNFSLEKEPKN